MSDKPLHRRQFFRRGLGELLKPLANALEPVERAINEFERLGRAASTPEPRPRSVALDVWLRPPGALPEQKFLETCSRCGECVSACPADAIRLDPAGTSGKGAPYIVASETACVVCDGLQCMNVCPSGALVPTPLAQIKMGTAVWREHQCVRSSGQDCTACVDICPLGTAAIDLICNEIQIKPLACIGCGLCEQHCPTEPRAISVIPVAARG